MTETAIPAPDPAAAPLTHVDALPVGTRLAEFEINGLLGVGGFGMVYQAFDHSLQRDVAIKEFMPAALARRSEGADVIVRSSADEQVFLDGLKSFVVEARLLAQFDHASLVKVFRFWEENKTAYMVMPLYRGITLKQARAQMRCPPPEEWLRKVLWSVLGALKVLHTGNTMHRDISPENIFLQDLGPPVLLDLGAARRAIHEKNQHLTATLKFSYAPIEQYGSADGMRQGPWTDLYALASVVHGCLTNELPLPATLRVVKDRLPSFESVARKVHDDYGLSYSAEFLSALDQAISIRPSGRPRSTSAFARLMGLQVPPSMSKFDWRAELEGIYIAPGTLVSDAPREQATTVAARKYVPTGADPNLAAAPASADGSPVFSRGRAGPLIAPRTAMWLAASAAVLAFAGVAVWELQSPNEPVAVAATPSPNADPPITGASAEVPAVASTPAATASDQNGFAQDTSHAAEQSGGSKIDAKAGTRPNPSGSKRKTDHRANAGDKKTVVGNSIPVAAPVVEPNVAPAPSNATAAAEPVRTTVPNVRQAPSAAGHVPATNPLVICAERNFFARPMCIHEECQKPEHASLLVCIEHEKRWREPRSRAN